ncbi:DUF4838 domain-containing protein [Myroides sp. LJL110]
MIGCQANNTPGLKADYYLVDFSENHNSQEFANYFYSHLTKRISTSGVVYFKDQQPKGNLSNVLRIFWQIDPNLQTDYCVEKKKDQLFINVKNKSIATWITYCLIEAISQEDKRIDAFDLPVNQVNFFKECLKMDFSYREPYYLSNLIEDQSGVLANNNVELDWAIWGHNLIKVLSSYKPLSQDSFALDSQERNPQQLCFSSQALFQDLTQYIIDNHGDGENKQGVNFMITPLDNDIVCQCQVCLELGNTKKSATSAVVDLLSKLSNRFENHAFYLVAYRTTKDIAQQNLPKNTGVFISTIDLEKGIDLTQNLAKKATKDFVDQIHNWNKRTKNIYLWDYSCNYDDYMSPLPALSSIQKQLEFFKQIGVTGVFFNGSGYDYSFLQDLHTYVISNLLKDTQKDIYKLIEDYLGKFYPASKDVLLSYYVELEKNFELKNTPYDIYGSMTSNLNTYLDTQKLLRLYQDLKQVYPQASLEEQSKLNKVISALSFSALQIAYLQKADTNGFLQTNASGFVIDPQVYTYLKDLEKAKSFDIHNYKEHKGDLGEYLEFWQELLTWVEKPNLLLGRKWLENDSEFNLLNNGVIGYQNDYHIGWVINHQPNIELGVFTGDLQGIKDVEFRFLVDQKHHFVTPSIIEIWGDYQIIAQISLENTNSDSQIITVRESIDLTNIEQLRFKIVNKLAARTAVVMDEIQLTDQ